MFKFKVDMYSAVMFSAKLFNCYIGCDYINFFSKNYTYPINL